MGGKEALRQEDQANRFGVYCVYNLGRQCEGTAMRSREVIELLEADGWCEVAVKGSHHQFRHPTKPGRVTVPHPKSDLPKGTYQSILKQAGLK